MIVEPDRISPIDLMRKLKIRERITNKSETSYNSSSNLELSALRSLSRQVKRYRTKIQNVIEAVISKMCA